MFCSAKGEECSFPCKILQNGCFSVADSPADCKCFPKNSNRNLNVLKPFYGKKLTEECLATLASLAAVNMNAADTEAPFAPLRLPDSKINGIFQKLENYREVLDMWKSQQGKREIRPKYPVKEATALFLLVQEKAGCADPILDFFVSMPWMPAVENSLFVALNGTKNFRNVQDEKE